MTCWHRGCIPKVFRSCLLGVRLYGLQIEKAALTESAERKKNPQMGKWRKTMRFTWFAKCLVLLAVFALLVPGVMLAQNVVTGGISGTVTDPSGAVVPNAALTLKSSATGETQQTNTGSTGLYNFALL